MSKENEIKKIKQDIKVLQDRLNGLIETNKAIGRQKFPSAKDQFHFERETAVLHERR